MLNPRETAYPWTSSEVNSENDTAGGEICEKIAWMIHIVPDIKRKTQKLKAQLYCYRVTRQPEFYILKV